MIKEVLDYLDELYPNPKCELKYNKDYGLLEKMYCIQSSYKLLLQAGLLYRQVRMS